MKRCPKCHRYGVEVNQGGKEQCSWRECLWVNKDDIDVDKVEHPFTFHKFRDSLRRKTSIG